MKIFVITAHRLSSTHYTGISDQLFQGMIQGNGSALPAWMINAIILILYLYQLGLVPTLRTLISNKVFQLIAQLFVDDTDLKIDNKGDKSIEEIIFRA